MFVLRKSSMRELRAARHKIPTSSGAPNQTIPIYVVNRENGNVGAATTPIALIIKMVARFMTLTLAAGLSGVGLEGRSETGACIGTPQFAQKMRPLSVDAPH